ncbi:helix-turn-helix domain-containing protein [Vallitalea okinawensis]|uniref:helix-turn-helix domain-containing protein n=1 Tax=Vallitalea okinawensis TaxID=2078660 RepID=UPI0013003E32|nr:helix-turn-helix domain-containing protein [Vallitalea okinawensis]
MHKNLKFNILSEGQINGVSATCRKYNISRTIYYRWLKRYKAGGIDGLDDIKKDFVPINKTSTKIENALLNLFKTYPRYGPKAIKYLLEEIGYNISESAVFNVMKRHNLTNKESRIRFAKKKESNITNILPPLSELNSGECWLLWTTYYGNFENVGNIYEYTILDVKSRIACSRLYQDMSFDNFENLLTAVAIPVAQTLNFTIKYLCFFQDSKIIKQSRNIMNSMISKIVQDNGLDVKIHILNSNDAMGEIDGLRKQYTESCLTFLMPLIYEGLSFNDLKIRFQKNIRAYNISNKVTYENEICSPIEYYNKLSDNQLILPLWAYIDRQY